MAADLTAKHVDWNSRLTTRRGKLLRDYADENFGLIFGPDTPTNNPYNPSATPDVLDIALTKDLPFRVYLTSCSALSSDHLPVLIDTACRSFFHHPPDRPNLRRTDRGNFQTHLQDKIPFDPDDPRPPTAAGIQDDMRVKNRLRKRWQVTRGPSLKAEVNRLQRSVTHRLNEWRNDQWSATLESFHPEDHSLWRNTKRVMRVPTPFPPPCHSGGNRSLSF